VTGARRGTQWQRTFRKGEGRERKKEGRKKEREV
jgi:hypothetical protein